jgi:hypothetical protein
MIMATRRSMWLLLSFFIVAGLLLGFAIAADAETMKCKTVGVTLKYESVPVDDQEGHILGLQTIEGLSIFENGEIARTKIKAMIDRLPKSIGFLGIGYFMFYFDDGSTIVANFERRGKTDEKGVASTKFTSEITKGTGRFAGIKGTISGPGKNFIIQGEAIKSYNDFTFTYTLPPK